MSTLKLIKDDKTAKKEFILSNAHCIFSTLKGYLLKRYNNFEDIGYFHVEYIHTLNKLILEVFGTRITKENFLPNIQLILDGIYDLYQKEGESTVGELYRLMIRLEIIKDIKESYLAIF